jgi:ABC-2 type transport system permease protein
MKSSAMRWRRIFAVAKAETRQLIRDRFTLSLLLTVPAVQLILFGFAVNLDPKEIPIAIAGPGAEAVRPLAEQSSYFRIIAGDLSSGAAEQLVRDQRALIAIETGGEMRILADASDPAAIRPALLFLQIEFWRRLHAAPVSLSVQWLYNENGEGSWSIAPALIGVIVMIATLLLGALSLVRERERGTWESLLSAPLTPMDALSGKLAPLLMFAMIQTLIVIGLAHLLFAVPVRGSLLALLAAAALFATAHLLIGFVISSLAANQLQAVQTAVFFYLPCMLLSGFMFPFQGMPRWAQAAGETIPLTHFVRIARGVLLRGEGFASVVIESWPVSAFVLFAVPAARWVYRSRLQ